MASAHCRVDDMGMNINGHAIESATRRDLDPRILLAKATVAIPANFRGDAAVNCGSVGERRIADEPDHRDGASNGDTVVAIVRDGEVRTIMFRRSTQPFTADALRVDRCFTYRKDVR